MYSAGMSAIHEYFFEAFPEDPSIQDLIVTPVGGFILGELFFLFGLPHPLTWVVDGLEAVIGPTMKKHEIRLQVGYGNTGFQQQETGHREMSIVIKGIF